MTKMKWIYRQVSRFKTKYHPEECDKQQKEAKLALQSRRKMFETLKEKKYYDGVTVDVECTDKLVRILDAAVIILEGGNDQDLAALDNPVEEPSERSRQNSESCLTFVNNEKKPDQEDGEDGELSDSNDKKDTDEKSAADKDKPLADTKDLALEMTISPEQEELKKKAIEYQKQQEAAAAEEKAQRRKKKSLRKKSDYSYESDSESGSDSDSDPEPAPPGLEDVPSPQALQIDKLDKDSVATESDSKNVEKEDDASKNKEKVTEAADTRPRLLHRTNSIFLRNLAPSITKQEVEALCRRFPGFKRVALQDPQPERRFFRRGWITFSMDCNIKDVCWSLNNIRLRDCELGATLNRELKIRVRAANGITVHKQIMRNDIKIAAKIIQILDKKHALWEDPGEEKKDEEKEPHFGFVSRNPVLKNITDYLVEEGSFEEDELVGETGDERKDANTEVTIEKDESLSQALDQMILYLRLVHSVDYYSANEYPDEDEMPHRCGIMHARGTPPGSKILQNDINEWITSFEKKIKPFLEASHCISDTEAIQLGRKNPDSEVEKFVQSNTQELSKDKWLCPLSGKKFKGPDFVRKHIFNKHQEKIEEVKQEVKFFNNYLLDPKRPSLPEHPSNRPKPAPSPQPPQVPAEQRAADPYSNYLSPAGMGGGYGAPRPPMYGSGGGAAAGGVYQSPFTVRDTRPPPETFRRANYGGGGGHPYRRSDPRQLIQYTDLDAPGDSDIF